MSFEEAVKELKKEYPDNYIKCGYDFPDKYLFVVSGDKNYYTLDFSRLYIVVNKKDKKVHSVLWQDIALSTPDDEYDKIMSNPIYVK